MSKIVVADSTCLIALCKMGKIKLLELLFKKIYIPKAVYEEVVIKGNGRPRSEEIKTSNWIIMQPVKDSFKGAKTPTWSRRVRSNSFS